MDALCKERQYIIEGILVRHLLHLQHQLQAVENALVKQGSTDADVKKAVDAADAARKTFLEDEDKPSDKKILAATAMMFYTDIDKSQHPIGFYESIKKQYGDLNDEATYKKWAEDVFNTT